MDTRDKTVAEGRESEERLRFVEVFRWDFSQVIRNGLLWTIIPLTGFLPLVSRNNFRADSPRTVRFIDHQFSSSLQKDTFIYRMRVHSMLIRSRHHCASGPYRRTATVSRYPNKRLSEQLTVCKFR